MEELELILSPDMQEAVWLGLIRSKLGDELGRCNPHRCREGQIGANGLTNRLPHLCRCFVVASQSPDVEKSLIEAETFDVWSERAENSENGY
jgi:hypothetical protein